MLPNDWIAAETSLLLFIPREDFLNQLKAVPEAALALARDFERRLTRSKGLSTGLVLADVETRLYQALTTLAREEGEESPEGDGDRPLPDAAGAGQHHRRMPRDRLAHHRRAGAA